MTTVNASIVAYKTAPAELAGAVSLLITAGADNVYVVDNSPDTSLQQVSEREGAIYVHSETNCGYGAAHNKALRLSLASEECLYHLVMNSDISFEPGILKSIKAHMDRHPDIGQLIPRVTYPDGRLQPVVRLLPTPLDVFGRRFLPDWLFRRRNEKYTLAKWDHATEADIAYHQGSFMFLRMDALRRTGIFDERFFMYPEDIDLTRRIHAQYRTVYWPEVTIVHHHRASSYKSPKMLAIHCVNMVRYFNKWGWFHDPERRRVNKQILSHLKF